MYLVLFNKYGQWSLVEQETRQSPIERVLPLHSGGIWSANCTQHEQGPNICRKQKPNMFVTCKIIDTNHRFLPLHSGGIWSKNQTQQNMPQYVQKIETRYVFRIEPQTPATVLHVYVCGTKSMQLEESLYLCLVSVFLSMWKTCGKQTPDNLFTWIGKHVENRHQTIFSTRCLFSTYMQGLYSCCGLLVPYTRGKRWVVAAIHMNNRHLCMCNIQVTHMYSYE